MSWNYRILRKPFLPYNKTEIEHLYSTVEVYYNKNGKIEGWCKSKHILEWDNLGDLIGTIRILQRVIGKPILEEKDNTLVEVTIKSEETNKNGKID